ncbi:MAG: Uma2 family endonuclease [Desulfobacterales bacterium]
MGLPLIKQEYSFSYKDYCQWDDGERWEIIDGIEYSMTAPSRIHQEISMELSVRLYDFFKNKNCKVYSAPFDVRLSEIENADDEDIFTVVQPDITVVCDPSRLDERGCRGTPDLIVEIVSPSSVGTDMKIKRELYERYCVKEYWIIHPYDKIVMIYCLGKNNQYAKSEIYTQEDILESKLFEDLKIKVADILASF